MSPSGTAHAVAVAAYRKADQRAKMITETYMRKVGLSPKVRRWRAGAGGPEMTAPVAKILARQDPGTREAAGDRVHYAEQATMYGISTLIETLSETNRLLERIAERLERQ